MVLLFLKTAPSTGPNKCRHNNVSSGDKIDEICQTVRTWYENRLQIYITDLHSMQAKAVNRISHEMKNLIFKNKV